MTRTRRGKSINGWLAIDKPPGLTSTAVVNVVKRLTKAAKVGHGGTLDPLATGVLPVALGQATKTVQYVMEGLKHYQFVIRWGEERDTDDSQGKVIATSGERPSAKAIIATLPAFTGKIEQVPPRFSAIKLNGRRAYEIARSKSDTLLLTPRWVRVQSFTLIARYDLDHAQFEVRSGKGVYMRALARDLARALGTTGHVTQLRRVACGPFHSGMAISLDKLEELEHSTPTAQYLLPVATALADIPALVVSEQEAYHLGNGQSVSVLRVLTRNEQVLLTVGGTVRAVANGKVVALARVEDGALRPVHISNL